ncbi:MAG: hypothetical protein V1783_01265 [Bacteroidota bacterium]
MAYIVEWLDSGVVIKYIGEIDILDLFKIGGIITNDKRYGRIKYVISDFLKVKSLEIAEISIKQLSLRDEIPSILNPNLKFSIVSDNQDILSMVMEYIDLMKVNEWKIQLFDNLEDSMKWCLLG